MVAMFFLAPREDGALWKQAGVPSGRLWVVVVVVVVVVILRTVVFPSGTRLFDVTVLSIIILHDDDFGPTAAAMCDPETATDGYERGENYENYNDKYI
jgi:hypothetical protein